MCVYKCSSGVSHGVKEAGDFNLLQPKEYHKLPWLTQEKFIGSVLEVRHSD